MGERESPKKKTRLLPKIGRAIWPKVVNDPSETFNWVEYVRDRRERRARLMRELPILLPLLVAGLLVLNLTIYFGGDINSVRAVFSAISISQLALVWVTGIVFGLIIGFLLGAPDLYTDPRVDLQLRSQVAAAVLAALLLGLFLVPLFVWLVVAAAQVLFRNWSARHNRSEVAERKTPREWLAGETRPNDEVMRRYWDEGRSLLADGGTLGGDAGNVAPRSPAERQTQVRLAELLARIEERAGEIQSARRLTLTDALFRIGGFALGSYLTLLLLQPAALGPQLQMTLSDGRQIVGYHLETSVKQTLIVADEEHRAALLPSGVTILDEKLCTDYSGGWALSAADLLNGSDVTDEPLISSHECSSTMNRRVKPTTKNPAKVTPPKPSIGPGKQSPTPSPAVREPLKDGASPSPRP